jgi:lipopolysaccharide export LptBFGC system permease protein LptF
MGTAFASIVTGFLLLYTQFDEKQNVQVEGLLGNVAAFTKNAELWQAEKSAVLEENVQQELKILVDKTGQAWEFFDKKIERYPSQADHGEALRLQAEQLKTRVEAISSQQEQYLANPQQFQQELAQLKELATGLKAQSPETLLRLRIVEIGLPLLLSVISIAFALKYPLSEARCHEIKEELARRHAAETSTA